MFTITKLKSSLPQLKQPVNKMFRSGVVYQIKCPGCQACYVGQSVRHLQTRFREHINLDGPLKLHLAKCAARLTEDDIEILESSTRNEQHLLTLEALFIRDTKPKLNTKEEYKSRALIIRSWCTWSWNMCIGFVWQAWLVCYSSDEKCYFFNLEYLMSSNSY